MLMVRVLNKDLLLEALKTNLPVLMKEEKYRLCFRALGVIGDKTRGAFVDQELIGNTWNEDTPKEEKTLDIFVFEDKEGYISIYPKYKYTFTLEDIEPYLSKEEVNIPTFMKDRWRYNSRLRYNESTLYEFFGKKLQPKIITVIGRRWFDKVNGNTYHSVDVYVNGDHLVHCPFAYGYGDHYQQTALALLQEKDESFKKYNMLWKIKEDGHKLIISVSDVARRKDL